MKKILKFTQKISKYVIAAVLVIVPLLPKFPLLNVTGTYVSVRFEDIILLSLALLLVPKILMDFKSIIKDKILMSFVIFFAVTFVSLISGAFVSHTLDLRIGFLHWARRIEYVIPFFAVYLLTPKEEIRERISFYFKIILIDIVIAFGYGIGQRYFNFPVIITQNEEYSKGIALRWTPGSHINSTFAGHYDLSAFMVLVLPILIGVFFNIKNKLSKFLILISSATGLWLLINSVSRTAQAAYLVAVTITLLLLKKIKGLGVVVAISLICMLMSTSLNARFTEAVKSLYQHITAKENFSYVIPHFNVKAENLALAVGNVTAAPAAATLPSPSSTMVNDVSIAIRINVEWPRAMRAFIKNPLLGTGYSSIDLATDNDYLRMLGETGILGFLAFFLIFGYIAKELIRGFQQRQKFDKFETSFMFGVFGGLAGTFMIATLIDLFEASKFATIFWLVLGCSVLLIKSASYEE